MLNPPWLFSSTLRRGLGVCLLFLLVCQAALTAFSIALPGLVVWGLPVIAFALLVILLIPEKRPLVASNPSLDAVPGVVVQVDSTGHIRHLNKAAHNLLQSLRKDAWLLDSMDWEASLRLDDLVGKKAHQPGVTSEFEARIEHRRFRVAVAGRTGEDGLRLVQLTDITEFRAMSERVAQNEQRFRSLFSENPDAVFSLGLDGRFVEANRAARELTGYKH